MDWAPHVTVAAIIERDGKFLLVDEVVNGNRVLNQPAGHLEEGETLIDAVIRETLEETAWHFRPSALLGIYRWRQPGGGHTFLRVAFSGEITSHDADRELDAGIIRSVWMTASQLASARRRLRSPMVLRCVNDYRSGARHALSIVSDIV